MAQQKKYSSLKRPDREVLAALRAIAGELGAGPSAQITMTLAGHSIFYRLNDGNAEDNPAVGSLLAQDSTLVDRFHLDFGLGNGMTVRVDREEVEDAIVVTIPDPQQSSVDMAVKALSITSRHLPAYSRSEATEKLLGPEMAEFYRRREEGLVRLEGLSQKLIEDNERYRRQLDEKLEEDRRRLADSHEAAQTELLKAVEAQRAELASQEEALKVRLKDVDDRDSRFARRQLRRDLKDALASHSESFTLSKATRNKRISVHLVFVALLLSTIVFAGLAIHEGLAKPNGDPNWVNLVRATLSAAAFLASTVFYIRWNDDWFRQHADEEFRLKRLELDIDRASWVVEMALEWQSEKDDGVIPHEIMEGVTRNLFVDPVQSRPQHPSNDLASALLGASAGLAVKLPGGSEVHLDRKGMQQFRKDTKDQA